MSEACLDHLLLAVGVDAVGPAGPSVGLVVVDGHTAWVSRAQVLTLTVGEVKLDKGTPVHEVAVFLHWEDVA